MNANVGENNIVAENTIVEQELKEKTDVRKAVYGVFKRIIDILGGFVGAILLIPVTIGVYIARKILKEDDGPLFYEQLRYGNGIDHNWVLNTKGDIHQVCATLESPVTGIVLNVYTDEPGIQVYCGNFLDGTLTGKKNTIYNFRASVCLETQKYPDTPNKADWPTAVVRPGEKYQSHCIYKFSVHK